VLRHGPFTGTSEKDFNDMMETNVRGVFFFMKELILEIERNSGIIINISSGAGKHGIPGMAAYCASKFAVIGLTEAVAQESSAKIIAVCPGGVDTMMYLEMTGRRPMLRPEHIASRVHDICAHPGRYRSGQSVEIYTPFPILNPIVNSLAGNRRIADFAKRGMHRNMGHVKRNAANRKAF
jgi:3-oxoacyl-[acyl-carrier protein] reductase